MDIIEIDEYSEAFEHLVNIFAMEDTYKVRIIPRFGGIAIKRNEGMWSPTLSVEF